MTQKLLRYQISSWRQLPQCMSNNDGDLTINVADYIHGDQLRGFRISVDHPLYGTLFATVLNARGSIITKDTNGDGAYDLSHDAILNELRKFGFIIYFNKRLHLSGDQITYLLSLRDLHYEKVRNLHVWWRDPITKEKVFTHYTVAFKTEGLGDWLHNTYAAPKDEFEQALIEGQAISLKNTKEFYNYSWDWLDYVAGINDLCKENASDMIYYNKEV